MHQHIVCVPLKAVAFVFAIVYKRGFKNPRGASPAFKRRSFNNVTTPTMETKIVHKKLTHCQVFDKNVLNRPANTGAAAEVPSMGTI
jgi:hypothetical protein